VSENEGKEKAMKAKLGVLGLGLLLLLVLPLTALAQAELAISVSTSQTCGEVAFAVDLAGGAPPYALLLEFGDGDSHAAGDLPEGPLEISHPYLVQGEYAWTLTVEDADGAIASTQGAVSIEGPAVTLSSEPFPPLVTLESGTASVDFTAEATGGTPPYSFTWDLDGDGLPDEGLNEATASHTYTEGGKFHAVATVTDGCGFTATDTLTVVVIDPEQEDACHPMAKRIADAVNGLFPDQAEDLYTCEDIFDIFEGALTGYQLGFGRMWHAYQLAQTMEDLTWEEIRDWHLAGSGWGILTQLDRFADLLEEHDIRELMGLVTSGEASLGDIRTAVRSVLRYEADFDDALQRLVEGANPGELGQLYKLAAELDVTPTELDVILEGGSSLSDIRHAAKFAARTETDWVEILVSKTDGASWGEIGQAYRLADEDTSPAEILAVGVKEFRQEASEEDRLSREEDRNKRMAERLAEAYAWEFGDVMALFSNGKCAGDWACVRNAIRDQAREQIMAERNQRTAEQIAGKYGADLALVIAKFDELGDWGEVRAYFRNLAQPSRGGGKK